MVWSKRYRLMLGIGLIIGIAFAYGFFATEGYTWLKKPFPGQQSGKDSEVAKQDSKIKITPNTDIVQRIVYAKCGEAEEFRIKPPDNMVGLNYQQVQKLYVGWTIDKFDIQEVHMTLTVDSYCREHANNMFLGIKDGFVAIYCGLPGPKAIVREITKIPANTLTPQDVAELQKGVIVKSREELLQVLEGLEESRHR